MRICQTFENTTSYTRGWLTSVVDPGTPTPHPPYFYTKLRPEFVRKGEKHCTENT